MVVVCGAISQNLLAVTTTRRAFAMDSHDGSRGQSKRRTISRAAAATCAAMATLGSSSVAAITTIRPWCRAFCRGRSYK